MQISEFYQQARALLNDVDSGAVDATTLSPEGRLALDIAANKVSVNDLSNDGRTALGLDPLPQPQGMVTSPIPFGSKVGQAALDTTASVIKSLGLDTLAARTGEMASFDSIMNAIKAVPGQLQSAGETLLKVPGSIARGEFGTAGKQALGGIIKTGEAAMGIGAPAMPLIAPVAAATGMATEELARRAGVPEVEIPLPKEMEWGETLTINPRTVGEFAGPMSLGLVSKAAGRVSKVRMPAIVDPELAHLRYGMLHERINVSQAAKNPNIGEGTRAQLNARAATLRQAERELAKGTYSNKSDLFKLLYDQTTEAAQDAATRTKYVDPVVAGREATVRPGGAVNVTGRESPMGAAAPGVADIAEAERAQARQLAESVGLDPNLYGGPVESTPTAGVVETPTMRPAGPIGPVATEPYPGLREIAPESLEGAVAETLKPRGTPEGEAQFPDMYGVTFQDLGKSAPKGKTRKGPKGKRSQLVQIIKDANPELSTNAAAKVAKITEDATAKAEAQQAAAELPAAKVKKKITVADVTPVEPTPAEVVQEAKAAVDNVVMEDATARIEAQPSVVEAIRPEPLPTPEAPGSTVISDAPPVESAAPVPAQTRVTKPTGAEKYFRETTKRKLLAMGFEDAQVEKMWQAIQADPSLRSGVSEMLRKWRKQNKTAADFIQSAHEGGRINVQVEREVINELAGQVTIGEAGGGSEVPQEGVFWRPPEGVAQATAPTVRKPGASTLPEVTRISYQVANEVLHERGRKLVISTEADPGKPAETVFLLRKLNGEPVLNESTGQPISYRTPEAAVEATMFEGPGAMAATPDSIAFTGLTADAKSANLTVQKLFRAAGVEQGDIGFFTSHFRLNTPSFVTRFDPNAHLIFSHGVDMAMRARKFKNAIMKRVFEIAEQLDGLKETDDLFLMGKVREMKPEQAKAFLAQVSPKVKRLWELHRALDDEIFNQVKRSDPTIKYRKDHITQFPLDAALEQFYNDLKHADDMSKQFPNEERYQKQAEQYKKLIERINEQRNAIENMRFERQPDGSYFGPLNEARKLNLDYSRSYIGVMQRYLDGVERKLFLDRTLPVFKRYIKADSLANKPLMREYMHDWMDNLRGMYGRRWRMSIENTLEALGVDNPFERQRWAADFDSMINVVNGGQAILYMGLRAKSVLNNAFQTLMTTYPEVGARSFAHGLSQLFTKRGRELARQLGVVDFVPDNLGELYREASDAFQSKNPLKILNAATTAGARVALRPFQLIEIGNNIISANAGFHYARNVLKLDPFKAAEYAKAMALRTNYIMHQINTPMAFTGPIGKMGGFLQRFKINYAEQLVQNYEKFMKGDRGPFIRQLGVYMALTGTEGLAIYNIAADQAMKRFGVEWPRFNPLQWTMNQLGVAGGSFFENMAPSLAIATPGAGGDVTTVIKPVIAQTVQNIATQGPAALVPSAARDVARAFAEAAQGGAMSTRTGHQIAQRPWTDVLASSVGLQPWAEGLRNRYMGQIATALEGGRVDVAMRLANEARQKGLRITGNELQAIRNSVRQRARGSSTAGQLTQQILQSLGIK